MSILSGMLSGSEPKELFLRVSPTVYVTVVRSKEYPGAVEGFSVWENGNLIDTYGSQHRAIYEALERVLPDREFAGEATASGRILKTARRSRDRFSHLKWVSFPPDCGSSGTVTFPATAQWGWSVEMGITLTVFPHFADTTGCNWERVHRFMDVGLKHLIKGDRRLRVTEPYRLSATERARYELSPFTLTPETAERAMVMYDAFAERTTFSRGR